MSGDGFVCALTRRLAVGLLAVASLAALAAPRPEILLSPPDDLSRGFGNNLVSGFALDASGSVVPAAYLRSWSESRQAYVLWVTDGAAAGTHLAATVPVGEPGAPMLLATGSVGAFFIGHDDQAGWQVFRTNGPASSAHVLTNIPEEVSWIVGVIDGKAIISKQLPDLSAELFAVDPDTGALSDLGHAAGRYPNAFATQDAVITVGQPVFPQTGYIVTSFPQAGGPFALPVPPPNVEWKNPHALGGSGRLMCAKAYTEYPSTTVAELYCSDGTVAGTRRPTPSGMGMRLLDNVEFHLMGDRVLFQGMLNNVPPRLLWSTDGTDAGTQALTQSGIDDYPPCTDGPNGTYFITGDNGGESGQSRLFITHTDGTTAGTHTILQLPNTSGLCGTLGVDSSRSGIAYLPVGTTLYRSDGTPAGTYPVDGAPMLRLSASSGAHSMSIVDRWLVFVAFDEQDRGVLWRLDLDPIFTNAFDGS